jgi:hypothetical protein
MGFPLSEFQGCLGMNFPNLPSRRACLEPEFQTLPCSGLGNNQFSPLGERGYQQETGGVYAGVDSVGRLQACRKDGQGGEHMDTSTLKVWLGGP